MYANLRLTVWRNTARRTDAEIIYAWLIEAEGANHLRVSLDGNDGLGNYAVEAGTRIIDLRTHSISVCADF